MQEFFPGVVPAFHSPPPAPTRPQPNPIQSTRDITKPQHHIQLPLLVPGHKYPKTGIKEIYGKTSVRVCAPIGMIPLHFRVLMAWDKYRLSYRSWALPLSPCSPPTPLHAGTLQVASSLLLLCHPNNARAQAQRASSRVIHYVIGSHFPRPFIPGLVSEAVTTGNLTCTGSTYPLPPQQDGGR